MMPGDRNVAKPQRVDTSVSAVEGLRVRIAVLIAVRNLLRFLTCWAFSLGMAVLVLRAVFAASPSLLPWAAAALAGGLIWAVAAAVRGMPLRPASRASLDRINRCGGLLMASAETDMGDWAGRLPPLKPPRVRWRGRGTIRVFALSAVFAAGSFLVPARFIALRPPIPLDVSRDAEKLKEQLEALAESEIISEHQLEVLEDQLEKLRQDAKGTDPVKTWEAIDHLNQSLRKQAEQAAASFLKQTEEMSAAEMLAQGLMEDPCGLPAELSAEAMAQLASMAQSLAAGNQQLKNQLGNECLNACKSGRLSSEQLSEMLAAMKAGKQNMAATLAKLSKAGLIDPKMLKLCEKAGACNSQGLMAFLKENAGCMGTECALSAFCRTPGSGGVSRGRGDAPMTWTDSSSEQNVAFKEEALPPASLQALKDSIQAGITMAAPPTEQQNGQSGDGTLDSAAGGSGEAHTQQLLPRHRGVVKRYFERQQDDQATSP